MIDLALILACALLLASSARVLYLTEQDSARTRAGTGAGTCRHPGARCPGSLRYGHVSFPSVAAPSTGPNVPNGDSDQEAR